MFLLIESDKYFEYFMLLIHLLHNYVMLDGIAGCMRIYCKPFQRAGRRVGYHSWQVQYILIQPEITPSNIIIIT